MAADYDRLYRVILEHPGRMTPGRPEPAWREHAMVGGRGTGDSPPVRPDRTC
jgi:hypothetical protein